MPKIVRLTLFKLPDEELIQEAIKKYSTLSQDAVKVSGVIQHRVKCARCSETYMDPKIRRQEPAAYAGQESRHNFSTTLELA